ncbi:MAG: hypothetical protein FJW61_08810 [Actinobacteria bacterium]|nr:hypothetical protein [Actinomycetota bacterium]MBM3713015.1 hypothetical protein [Actinomycetota bacterium]
MSLNGIHLWVIFGVFVFLFLLGFFYRVSIWLRGESGESFGNEEKKKSRIKKFLSYTYAFFKVFFSRNFFRIMKSFILDGIIHVNLFKDSRLKWFIHIFMFWGLSAFTLISIFHMISVATAPGGIPSQDSSGFVRVFGTLENRFTAFVLDISKVSIIFGALIAVLRFFIFKNKMKSVELKDKSAGVIISIIATFGFFYEAAFFTARDVAIEKSAFAPVGFILSYIFSFIKINWWTAAVVFFNLYIIGLLLFVAFIPYGKYSHMVFGPFVVVYNKFISNKKIYKL